MFVLGAERVVSEKMECACMNHGDRRPVYLGCIGRELEKGECGPGTLAQCFSHSNPVSVLLAVVTVVILPYVMVIKQDKWWRRGA